MKSLLTFGLVIASALSLGRTEENEETESALSRLPIGATLTNVSIPRFDDKKRRASLLTAKIMEVKSADDLRGEDLIIRLFDKEQKVSTTATMAAANYLLKKEQIVANGEILVRSAKDYFLARGQGGILSLKGQRGLLTGICETMLLPRDKPKKTSMNSILPLLTGIQLLAAAPPPEVTTEELVEFERQAAPRIVPDFTGEEEFAAAEKNEISTTNRLLSFLAAAGQTQILAQQQAAALKEPAVPFEDLFQPNQKRIVIRSDKGLYFDGENQELVYLGKISLQGRGMTMTCSDGLKVLFEQPVKKGVKKDREEDDDPLDGFQGIGELKQFAAAGNIRVIGKDKKGQPVEARGDRAVFTEANQTLIIRGDELGFRAGGIGLQSAQKNAYIVIRLLGNNNFTARTEGIWQTGIPDKFKKN